MKIIYPVGDGVAVVHPSGKVPLEIVAKKDVPAGVPYRLVEDDAIPSDRSERERWSADFSTYDGLGEGE